jgi:hypothetical protein
MTKWVVGAVALAVVLAFAAMLSSNWRGSDTGSASSQEKQYVGRFLPAGYEEQTVADRTLCASSAATHDRPS